MYVGFRNDQKTMEKPQIYSKASISEYLDPNNAK